MRFELSLVMSLLLAVGGAAASSPPASSWLEGPLRFLLTEDERERMSLDLPQTELRELTELFWARRDPNGAEPGNRLRAEFAAKVAAADEQFGNENLRGALTDRGRVLILLGVPTEHKVQPLQELMYQLSGRAQNDMSTSWSASRSFDRDAEYDAKKAVADVWVYTRDQIPAAAGVPKSQKYVVYVFVDREGMGVFELERRYQPSEWSMRVLDALPQAFVLHPDLTEAPVPRLLSDLPAAGRDELAWLDADVPWPSGAVASVMPGVATEDGFPVWMFVRVPNTVRVEVLVGRVVEDASGAVLGTFQRPADGTTTPMGTVVEQAVPRPEVPATLELALAAGGQPIAISRLSLPTDAVPTDQPYISPVYVGAEVARLDSYRAGAPFVFGGYHLLIRPEGRFEADEALAYFCLVVRPSRGDDGAPNVRSRLAIYGNSGRLTGQPYRTVALQEVAPNVYVFGSQLPLSVLEGYEGLRLKFWVEDAPAGVVRETEVPLAVGEVF